MRKETSMQRNTQETTKMLQGVNPYLIVGKICTFWGLFTTEVVWAVPRIWISLISTTSDSHMLLWPLMVDWKAILPQRSAQEFINLHWEKTALNGQDVYIYLYVHIIYIYILGPYYVHIYIYIMYRQWWLIFLSCEGFESSLKMVFISYCWWFRNPANQLIWQISQYLQGFFYCNWCRISSINSIWTKHVDTSLRHRPEIDDQHSCQKQNRPLKTLKKCLAKVLTTDEVTK